MDRAGVETGFSLRTETEDGGVTAMPGVPEPRRATLRGADTQFGFLGPEARKLEAAKSPAGKWPARKVAGSVGA